MNTWLKVTLRPEESGLEPRQAGPTAHAPASWAAVTMTAETPVLVEEEKTDRATSDAIFGADKCREEL